MEWGAVGDEGEGWGQEKSKGCGVGIHRDELA
jgi:hypothetical protein